MEHGHHNGYFFYKNEKLISMDLNTEHKEYKEYSTGVARHLLLFEAIDPASYFPIYHSPELRL